MSDSITPGTGRKRPRPSNYLLDIDDAPTSRDTFSPKMNLYEQTVKDKKDSEPMRTAMLGLPGLKPEDVTVNLLHDKLTISGESIDRQPQVVDREYISREIPSGNFSRVVKVPLGMRPEDFKARMQNGLLTVTFPKNPPKQEPHRIPIE